MKKYYISYLVTFILNGFIFSQTTLHVPSQYPTIQEALNAAQAGDTVLVQPGTYYENIFWPNINGIKLISAGNELNTIIDANHSGTGITFISSGNIDSSTVMKGFSIVNGDNVQNGGGIVISGAGPYFENIIISNNNAIENGGGILYHK